jgi:molybdate transport system regulatory protein
MPRIRIRIQFDGDHSLGPGKAQLLEAVAEHGSISAAARSMGMAYRHAWELVDDLNQCFRRPVVDTVAGGRAGGGAALTPFGAELVRRFRRMERSAARAMARDLAGLDRELAPVEAAPGPPARRKRPPRRS